MNALKTTDTGGFPLNLDDFRWIFGQDAFTGGVYQVFNSLLRSLGDNFIVYGCADLGANIGSGLIMLNGELIYVDEHAWTDAYFVKVTTYDASGLKTFLDTTTHNTYAKVRATLTGASGTLNWATAERFETIVKTNVGNYSFTKRETIKGRSINFPNVTTITLDATCKITLTSGAGNLYVIKSDGTTHVTLNEITDSSGYSKGEEIFIKIDSTSEPIIINSGTGLNDIMTPCEHAIIISAGSTLKLQANSNFAWEIMGCSKTFGDVLYTNMSSVTVPKRIFKKIIDIGSWDMDAAINSAIISHGIDCTLYNILSVKVMIFSRSGTTNIPVNLERFNAVSFKVDGWINELSDTQIQLERTSGGFFDDPSFDNSDGALNRGLITFEYINK